MALQLGLQVVAEGIENEQQLALLRSLRCHAAQGYLFAKPLDEAKATEILSTGLAPRAPVAKRRKRPVTLASLGKWRQVSPGSWGWAAAAVVVLLVVTELSSLPVAVEQTALPYLPSPPAIPSAPNPPSRVIAPPRTGRAAATRSGPVGRLQATDPHMLRAQTPPPQQPDEPPPFASPNPPAFADAPPRVETPLSGPTSLSIHVMHYHRVGHCVGRLVATRVGMAFVPDSKLSRDAFEFKYTEFVHVVQDDTMTIKSSTRTYRFKAIIDKDDKDPTLGQFDARITRWR